MLRFKSFSSASCGDDMSKLEHTVNDWLTSKRPHIRHMAQSPHGAHLVISFVYDDGQFAAALAEHAVAVPEVFEQEMQDAELDPLEIIPLPEAELPY
jgi:hypothetical protein